MVFKRKPIPIKPVKPYFELVCITRTRLLMTLPGTFTDRDAAEQAAQVWFAHLWRNANAKKVIVKEVK